MIVAIKALTHAFSAVARSANPSGALDVSYGSGRFTIDLTLGGAHVGELELNRSDAMKMAMTIAALATFCGFHRLAKEERAAVARILADDVVSERMDQIISRYNKGEITKDEVKQLKAEASRNPWPTESPWPTQADAYTSRLEQIRVDHGHRAVAGLTKDCHSACNIDPPYCLICKCYPDGAIAAVDPMSIDRPRQVASRACSGGGAVGGSGPP